MADFDWAGATFAAAPLAAHTDGRIQSLKRNTFCSLLCMAVIAAIRTEGLLCNPWRISSQSDFLTELEILESFQ